MRLVTDIEVYPFHRADLIEIFYAEYDEWDKVPHFNACCSEYYFQNQIAEALRAFEERLNADKPCNPSSFAVSLAGGRPVSFLRELRRRRPVMTWALACAGNLLDRCVAGKA